MAIAEQRIIPSGTDPYARLAIDPDRFTRLLIAFGANSDEREYFVLPMLRTGKEATFSMGTIRRSRRWSSNDHGL